MSLKKIGSSVSHACASALSDYPKVFTGFAGNLRESAGELKSVRSLCGMALLIALSVVVDQFSFYIGPVKITAGSIVSAALGCFYGPVAGMFAAGVGNLVKYFIRPDGIFFFGYTLNAMLGGALYGTFLYKMKVSLLRALSCKLLINVIVNGLLGTLWYSMIYGKGFYAIFWPRMLKNLITVPLQSAVIFIVLPPLIALLRRAKISV